MIQPGTEIDSNTVKWNKTIAKVHVKPGVKNFSVKCKLEDSEDEDQLYLKKVKVDNEGVISDFKDGNFDVEWLKMYPNIHVTDKQHWA